MKTKLIHIASILTISSAPAVFAQETEMADKVVMQQGIFWPKHETVGNFFKNGEWLPMGLGETSEALNTMVSSNERSSEEIIQLFFQAMGVSSAEELAAPYGGDVAIMLEDMQMASIEDYARQVLPSFGVSLNTFPSFTENEVHELAYRINELEKNTLLDLTRNPSLHSHEMFSLVQRAFADRVQNGSFNNLQQSETQDVLFEFFNRAAGLNNENNQFFSGLNFSELDLSGRLVGGDLRGSNLSIAQLNAASGFLYANLSGMNLVGFNASGKNLQNAILSNTGLTGHDLNGANLMRANLSGLNLTGLNFAGQNISGMDLANTNVTISQLSTASKMYILNSANFSGTGITQQQLVNAGFEIGWNNTFD